MKTITRPGKFEGETAMALFAYSVVMDGCAEDCDGYSRIDGPITVAEVRAAVEEADPENYYGLLPFSAEEEAEILACRGLILWERSDGFVDVAEYETDSALAEDWERVEASAQEEDDR